MSKVIHFECDECHEKTVQIADYEGYPRGWSVITLERGVQSDGKIPEPLHWDACSKACLKVLIERAFFEKPVAIVIDTSSIGDAT